MRKIILHIKNLNLHNDVVGKLYNMSASFLEGNIYSLSGLDYSGRDIFLNIIKGNLSEKLYEGLIYIDNRIIKNIKDLKENIYVFSLNNETLRDWTVSEYICLREGKWFLNKKNKENMAIKAGESLKKFGLEVSGEEKIGSLTEIKRYQIELVRAQVLGRKIIIIEDEFASMKYEELKIFAKWLKSSAVSNVTILLSTYSKTASYECGDIFLCFKKGCIVKICKKNDIKSVDDLDSFVLGNSINEKIKSLNAGYSYNKLIGGSEEVYSISGNIFGRKMETLSFGKGKIYSFIISSHNYGYSFYEFISGTRNKSIRYFVDRYEQKVRNMQDLADKKIISADKIGAGDSLVENMSVEDNLLLPSLNKLSPFNYIISQEELKNAVFNELKSKNIEKSDLIKNLNINQKICVSLERWIIFRPKVFIIFEPFIHCDNYGLSLIKSYLKKFALNGCSVIIIKSRVEYIEDISDEVIYIS